MRFNAESHHVAGEKQARALETAHTGQHWLSWGAGKARLGANYVVKRLGLGSL